MKTLLVVEDEPAVMKLLRCMLRQYSLIEATTAEEALLLFIDHDHRVDLLIADLTLPQLSGIQVALLLRSEIPDLPVILTSGYPLISWSHRDSADLKKLGSKSVAILEKPFDCTSLWGAVCELIGAPQAAKVKTA
jgi:two-component system, cell cycle sensor histidine kinase and response regulator CckA